MFVVPSYLSKNDTMNMAVKRKENDMTTKGSNRALDSKTPPNIISNCIRCRKIRGNRRVTHLGHLTQQNTPAIFEVLSTKLSRHEFRTGSAWCVASRLLQT